MKSIKDEDRMSPHVTFYKNSSFLNDDFRRFISGVDGDFGLPMQIKQIKVIQFNEESVKNRLVVGNHRHYGESGQWELVIVLGKADEQQFDFRYRNYDEEVKERVLMGGDVAVIPPGCSLALVAMHQGAMLIEISNKIYNSENYITDKLF
jgi:hypothetical protein